MGQPNKQVVDVESLQESGRRRGSCVDTFLIMSIVFLFVSVTAVAVGGVMMVMELRSELRSQKAPPHNITAPVTSELTGDKGDSSPVYKMQNFALLEAISGELNNSTINWREVHHGAGKSVGSNFIYDPNQSSVTPKKAGTYFMYLDLKLKCVHKCSAGILTVEVGTEKSPALLKCEVALRANSTSESRKCWTVSTIEAEMKLIARMFLQKSEKTKVENWKLEVGSQIGMFLVD